MKIHFILGGGKHVREVEALVESYRERVARYFPVEIALVQSKAKSAEDIRADESASILKLLAKADVVLLFDERGKEVTSPQLSEKLSRWVEDGAKQIAVVVGGAYGVKDDVRSAADLIVSFSPMIFPHQLARAMALEQVYRALDIRAGGKYHHA